MVTKQGKKSSDANTIIEDQDKLGAFITAIGRKAASLDRDIQVAALSAAAAFEKHGNVFYINRLYKVLESQGRGMRHVALTSWFLAFAGVMANKNNQSAKETPFVKDASKVVDLVGGAAMPWHDMKPSPAPAQVLDVLQVALAMLKRITTPKEGVEVVHAEMIEPLKELVAQFTPVEEGGEGAEPPESGILAEALSSSKKAAHRVAATHARH
jgi:hypothetical protein